MKLGNNQVNPGRGENQGTVVGPTLNINPNDLLVNPNPVTPGSSGVPQPIPREVGPGARPPGNVPSNPGK